MTNTTSYRRKSSAFFCGLLCYALFFATPLEAQVPNAWINEIHYDNTETDVMEGVEIVVEDATAYDISSFVLTLYNGSNGQPYGAFDLSQAEEGETVNEFTFYTLNAKLQNDLEGIALSYQNNLLQFLSYEGTMTATAGIAIGVTSEDIGVIENNQTPVGYSLQLSGIGNRYKAFAWEEATPHTFGSPNNHQQLKAIDGPEPVTEMKVEKIAPDKVEISWTKPIGVHKEDWDGVLLFASKAGANMVDLESKDFTSFNGGSNVYGQGTPTENGYTVARRETDTHGMATITGLEEGTTYHFVAYTAKIIEGTSNDLFSGPSEEIFITPQVTDVTNFTATPLYERVRLAWENPKGNQDWWKEVMILASESIISFIPDDVNYNANPQYGEGDNVGLGSYVVYRGKDRKVTVQGLENQKNYHFKIFVQYVSPVGEHYWSSGATLEAMPMHNIKLWTGNAGTNQFADADNWEPVGIPLSHHDIILNNDYVSQSYEVLLDGGDFSLNSLKILPSTSQSIAVKLENGLTLLDEDEALIIGNGGTLINRSNLILADGNFTLAPHGTYVHNNGSGHADLMNKILTTGGYIPGKVILDVPVNSNYITSLAGRSFKTLVLTSSSHTPTYQVSGGSNITILDTLLVDATAKLTFSGNSNSVLNLKGNLVVHGEANFPNRVLFDGSKNQHVVSNKVDGIGLQNIQIVKPQGSIFLHTNLDIGTDFTFEEGTIQTQEHLLTIDYSNSPNIQIASPAQILGNVKSIIEIGTGEVAIGTADLIIGPGEDVLGKVEVIRRSGEAATIEHDQTRSIQRNWEIHAQTPLTQPRQLTFMWNEGEDDDMDLSKMRVWKKTASGEWVALGDFADGTERVISAITHKLTQFTVADAHNPLPIDLMSFTVTLEKDHALLRWFTKSEHNNMGFEIEKSSDGKTFYSIGFVNGQGTSTVLHEYQFEDRDIFASAYYRLKQLDFNGAATYSPIRFLPINSKATAINIAPNPILKGAPLTIYTHDPFNVPIIENSILYNSSGLLTYKNNRPINLQQLEDELNLIFSDLPKGLYILQLVSTLGHQKIKLWKE